MSETETGRQSGICVVDTATPTLCVQISKQECWRLYVLLGDDAPFVRHQLNVIRHGGAGTVSLSTPLERRQVLDALLSTDEDTGALTSGLTSLRTALNQSKDQSAIAKNSPRRA
jgi:hypothetical protein